MSDGKIDDVSKQAIENLIIKEIELTVNNTYSVRMKFIFTAWIGPFLLLGAIILATEEKLKVPWSCLTLAVLGVAATSYLTLGLIAGRYEKGNWGRCDRLRSVLVEMSPIDEELGERLLDPRNERDVVWTYLLLFFVLGVGFGCSAYFAVIFV